MKTISNLATKTVAAIALVFLLICSSETVLAQGPTSYPPTWVYARAYNGWQIQGQQANTFTFNGGVCQYTPYNNGATAAIFVFSGFQGTTQVFNPVFINDVNPALDEVVTPTATTQSSASCGATMAPANSHTSFTLQSGTAGLQEAITNQLQSTPAFVVVLDKYWYQLISGFPSTTTPQSIISSVTGSANVYIVDTTTSPWQFYSWNGSKYVPTSPSMGIPFTSLTAISAPVALTTVAATCATNGGGCITTATTGGTIPASGAYTAGATYVTALGGETTLSTDTAAGATVTVGSTATNTITISSPAAETGAVGWRPYLTAASGASLSEILYAASCVSASTGQIVLNGVCAIGSNAVITAIVTGTATVPANNTAFPVASGSTSPLQNLVSYPPFPDQGTVTTTTVQQLGAINHVAGFLNSLGRHIKYHGTGYATTNSTTGTLTFAIKLASVPGVTSITPFTAVSGTTTASAVVNFTFDVDFTTQVIGTSGKIEAHGTVCYNLAGTAVCSPAQDIIITNGSAIDLTKQDQVEFFVTPTTTGTTHLQLRQLTETVLQ